MTPPSRNSVRIWLWGFLLVSWTATIIPSFRSFGDWVGSFGLVTILGSPLLLLNVRSQYHKYHPDTNSGGYCKAFVFVLALLAIHGMILGNSARQIVLDAIPFLVLITGFRASRSEAIWEDMRLPVAVLTSGSIVCAIALTDPAVLQDRSILNEQIGSHFESALILAPLLALVAASDPRSRWWAPFIVITAGCLATYLYFGRRGASTIVAIELVLGAIVIPTVLGGRVGLKRMILCTMGAVLALVMLFPFDVLRARFAGTDGVISTITTENARLSELQQIAASVWPHEILLGRGLGGVFELEWLSRTDGESFDLIRANSHSGVGLMMLKGGIVLLVLYLWPLAVVSIRGLRRSAVGSISRGAGLAACVLLPFQLIDGGITYSTPWTAFSIGMIMGRMRGDAMQGRVTGKGTS